MTKGEIESDYRVQELLSALNEGILDADFVEARLATLAGSRIDLIRYSDGEYDIIVE